MGEKISAKTKSLFLRVLRNAVRNRAVFLCVLCDRKEPSGHARTVSGIDRDISRMQERQAASPVGFFQELKPLFFRTQNLRSRSERGILQEDGRRVLKRFFHITIQVTPQVPSPRRRRVCQTVGHQWAKGYCAVRFEFDSGSLTRTGNLQPEQGSATLSQRLRIGEGVC